MKKLLLITLLLSTSAIASEARWFTNRCIDNNGQDYSLSQACKTCPTIKKTRKVTRVAYGKNCSAVFTKSFAKQVAKSMDIQFVDLTNGGAR